MGALVIVDLNGEDMKIQLSLTLIVIALLPSHHAQAEKGDWLVRARAVNIQPENKSDPIPALGVPTDAITVSDKLIPEVDVSYFVTKNIALELILTYPQKLNVSLSGTAIGSGKVLPPTLTVQYHFIPDGKFRPYLGAGVNYTRFSSVSLNVPGVGALDLDKDSWGGALQAGFDVEVDKTTFINFDIKKIYIDSDVKLSATGTKVSGIKLSPVVVGVGFGWKF